MRNIKVGEFRSPKQEKKIEKIRERSTCIAFVIVLVAILTLAGQYDWLMYIQY